MEESTNRLWGQHFIVPAPIVTAISELGADKRVVCNINGQVEYQCALISKGEGVYIIHVNKARMKQLKLKIGDQVQVSVHKDDSEYGLPVPEEFVEVMEQDPMPRPIGSNLLPESNVPCCTSLPSPKVPN